MFLWLVISSVVTGVGVIFEAPGEFHELGRWWRLKKLKKEVGWRILVTFVGLVLVIGGIIGEGIFEFLSADAETAIREHDEQVLGETIVQAGTAKDSADAAAKASERANLASDKAVDRSNKADLSANRALIAANGAKGKADAVFGLANKADTSARQALVLADSARKEADSFEKDIVSAKGAAMRVEEQLADRTLSDAQLLVIAGKLKAFAGQEYTLTAYWSSPESLSLANRIQVALGVLAGWKYNPEGEKAMMLGGQVGVLLTIHPHASEPTRKATAAFLAALRTQGLQASERMEIRAPQRTTSSASTLALNGEALPCHGSMNIPYLQGYLPIQSIQNRWVKSGLRYAEVSEMLNCF